MSGHLRRQLAIGAASVVGAFLLLVIGERLLWRGQVLPGVKLDGVAVSGKGTADAREAITAAADRLEESRLEAVAGSRSFAFTPGSVGLEVDQDAAIRAVSRAGRRGSPLAQALGFITRRLGPEKTTFQVSYSQGQLQKTVGRWATEVNAEPIDGGVRVEEGKVLIDPPEDGRLLDQKATARLVSDALRGKVQPPLRLPVATSSPAVDQAEVDRVEGQLRKVLAASTTLTVEGRTITLSPARVGALLTVATEGGELVAGLAPGDLHTDLKADLAGLEVPARDARFVVETPPPPPAPEAPAGAPTDDPEAGSTAVTTTQGPATPPPAPPPPPGPPATRLEPSSAGRELDAAPVAQAILAGEHHVRASLHDVAPRVDSARAGELRLIEPVSTFTTYHPAGQPRVKNIHRAADLLQGYVILPGEQFSMNKVLGKRTKAAGFVKAPVIYEGEFTEDIGGGVSQFATTFYNAAFFGGYKLVSAKAHTYYISRYPQGREATVSYPSPDLVIENNSSSGIAVQTTYTGSSITVTFWGDKEGKTVKAEGPYVGKRSGNGYGVTVWRVIERPGQPVERQRIVTHYRVQKKQAAAKPKPAAPAAPGAPAPAPAPPAPPPEPVAPPPPA